MIHFEMKSIDQIQTIADLCDYLDKYAKTTSYFSYDGTNRIEFRLQLHNHVLKIQSGNNICCDEVMDETFYDTEAVITRLFDLDVFGWSLGYLGIDWKRDGYLTTTYMNITLTR